MRVGGNETEQFQAGCLGRVAGAQQLDGSKRQG
jgi:hypothetical protein